MNRDVAVKVLSEAFALDPERLARFKREAQVLASLNHPKIAAIYEGDSSPPQARPLCALWYSDWSKGQCFSRFLAELFFMGGAGLGGLPPDVMAVEVNTSSTDVFRASVSQKLFTVVPASVTNVRNSWDVTPGGPAFLVVTNPRATAVPPVTVVVNWFQGRNTC